jgi:hypothetical protein
MALPADVIEKATKAASAIDKDVYLFNGGVQRARDLECIEHMYEHRGRKTALLVAVTMGGDPDAAYKITRYLQEKYDSFTILISGLCKSAGTLMAIGANELAFTPFGELGPLDIQLTKVDRFDQMQSGLTIQEAIETLEGRATHAFYTIVHEYIRANNGLMSFATASRAASDFVTQLYAPIFARIDPEEVGARSRSMRIAAEYGKRLAVKPQNVKSNTLKALAETYSSHSFVIDKREAESLFHRVRDATDQELALVTALGRHARFQMGQNTDFVFQALSTKVDVKKELPDHASPDEGRGSAPDGGNPPRPSRKADTPAKRQRLGGVQPVPRAERAPRARTNGAD